ncbi:MAG: heme ABC transporter ATP-binding protein [Microthrixaceae bacterium]
MSGVVALACRSVGVSLGGRKILDGVDIEVRHGELVALVGPNGAGKSTLVSVLAGDLAPTTGTVELDGRAIDDWSTAELAIRRAVLLQSVAMSFPFTVLESVRMGRAPWERVESEDERAVNDLDLEDVAVHEAMLRTDVAQFADRVYMSLSGGERARAAMARVLAQETQVLLLDEPTAALDIRHQEQVLGVAGDLARSGRAVSVVMHDLGLAAAHADRIVVLSGGRVVADGAPGRVLTSELLSDVYQCPIEVLVHPRTGRLLVIPAR